MTKTAPTAADLIGFAILDAEDIMWGCGDSEDDAWEDARVDAASNACELNEDLLVAVPCTMAVLASGDGQDVRSVIRTGKTLDLASGPLSADERYITIDDRRFERVAVTRAERRAL